MRRSGYDKLLSTYGTYTVFAPKNDGLRELVNALYNAESPSQPHNSLSSNNIEELPDSICESIVKRHIIVAAIETTQFEGLFGKDGSFVNANGDKVPFKRSDNGKWILNNHAIILQADVKSLNGYVNVIDKTIFPYKVTSERVIFEDEVKLDIMTDSLFSTSGISNKTYEFVSNQLKLEKLRFTGEQLITPSTYLVKTTFQSGYRLINYVNYLLSHQKSDGNILPSIIAQARAIRAFTYYNMAMLWGRIFIITKPILTEEDAEEANSIPQSEQLEVYEFAYKEICEAISLLPTSSEVHVFSYHAGLMLKAEIELTLGRNTDALLTLSSIIGDDTILMCSISEEETLPIYITIHLQLFKQEAEGDVEELENKWTTMAVSRYGYWAALKRLGKAQEITGCQDYELLMPFYSSELAVNPRLTQNPGY